MGHDLPGMRLEHLQWVLDLLAMQEAIGQHFLGDAIAHAVEGELDATKLGTSCC